MDLTLPVNNYGDVILETLEKHSVAVVIGEAGSGKTTQIPQILLAAGYEEEGIIGVTQPRRVAAISAARRVSHELQTTVGEKVGYAVRFEEKTSPTTVIKYLTDGTLLRECLSDLLLEKYSVLMLDEAHERSLNTDILFGVVRTTVFKRPKLKVLITSATLDSAKFSEYFDNCPVVNVEGSCYPVRIIHSKEDHLQQYVHAAIDVVMDIHCNKPPGDILLFLTGQAEITRTVKRLNKAVEELPDNSCIPLQVLPLYAALPLQKQTLVFTPTPDGCRRCVVATNVAETSITVDGIVYVVDPGTVKQKIYNSHSCMDSLQVVSISHVQAKQRAGRAGRTREGVCYRLYSKEYYENEMKDVSLPEIQRTSLVSTVLYLKSLEMDIDVLNFEFLDKPDVEFLQKRAQLEDALKQLHVLDAIDSDGSITAMGKRMAKFPLDPSLSRALIAAGDHQCEAELLTIASMLSVENVFEDTQSLRRIKDDRSNSFVVSVCHEGMGDHFALLKIYDEWTHRRYSKDWCREQGLDIRGMNSARDIRHQLSHMIEGYESEFDSEDEVQVAKMEELRRERRRLHRMTDDEKRHFYESRMTGLKCALTLGFGNRIAHRMSMHNGYRPINPRAPLCELHPSCSRLKPDDEGLLPEWIVYHEMIETSRPFLTKVCPVNRYLVEGIVTKLRRVDVHRLSGGRFSAEAHVESNAERIGETVVVVVETTRLGEKRRHDVASLQAARERFLKRKAKRM